MNTKHVLSKKTQNMIQGYRPHPYSESATRMAYAVTLINVYIFSKYNVTAFFS